MRVLIVLIVLLLLALSYYHWGAEKGAQAPKNAPKNISSGVVHYGKESLASLSSNGLVTLDDTSVRGPLEVNGSLTAMGAHIGRLQVNGHASLEGTAVDGRTEVNGRLTAAKSTFQKEVVVNGYKSTFDNCTIDSIRVKNSSWTFGIQIVELSNNSICKGSITFDSGKGTVILKEGSQILGSIIGGEVEKE